MAWSCREQDEHAERYSSQLQEAAARQIQLCKTSAAALAPDADTKGQLCKRPPDVIRGAVKEQVAGNSGGIHQKHHQGAPKQQLGTQTHSLPQVAVSKQDAAVSSRGHSMTDVGAEEDGGAKLTEPSCAAVPSIGKLLLHLN